MSSNTPELLDQLQARGLIHQCTDLDGLRLALSQGPVTFYLGFDATADSLHVGHLQALMLMRHLVFVFLCSSSSLAIILLLRCLCTAR
mgnify:CR=1 FL=1